MTAVTAGGVTTVRVSTARAGSWICALMTRIRRLTREPGREPIGMTRRSRPVGLMKTCWKSADCRIINSGKFEGEKPGRELSPS